MQRKWWKESVVYQIYPRSFYDSNDDGIGDIPGIIAKLDYIEQLGIDIIWLNPVYRSPNVDNGYDISDYQAIMDEFGTLEDWELLLNEIHKRGMKLIMDLVVNHTSDQHKWFIESRAAKNNAYRDYYIWREPKNGEAPNNWESFFIGPAWEYDTKTNQYYLHLFAKEQPDLNWETPKVRQEVYALMRWWLDKGIDGFRMDVINMISKEHGLPDDDLSEPVQYAIGEKCFFNGPKVHEYINELNKEVTSKYNVVTVGECPGVNYQDAIAYTRPVNNELDMIFHFELMCVDTLKGEWGRTAWKLADFKKVINGWQQNLHNKGWIGNFFTNHDMPRAVSRFGNAKKYRYESATMLATLLLSLEGTPYIFQGEEIGMTNVAFENITDYRDVETINYYEKAVGEGLDNQLIMNKIHNGSRDNSRTPMQWDNNKNSGFTSGTPWMKVNSNYQTINVANDLTAPHSIINYYRKMIKIRKNHLALIYGEFIPLCPDDKNLFIYRRILDNENYLIVLNFSSNKVGYPQELLLQTKNGTLLIGNYQNLPANISRQLRPYEALIYKL